MKYRKKPVVIEAFQFLPDDDGNFVGPDWAAGLPLQGHPGLGWLLEVKTLEGTMVVTKGNYVIKGIQGELYPCREDIFEATYERHRE